MAYKDPEYHKKWYQKNKEKQLKYSEIYYQEHREQKGEYYEENKEKILKRMREYHKKYYQKHKKKILKQTRQYHKLNKEKRKEYLKEYCQNHKEKHRKRMRKRMKNPKHRLNHNISKAIGRSLRSGKSDKHWESYVDFTRDELEIHLEKQFTTEMSWNNQGSFWWIDHIIPISVFNFDSPDQIDFKKCWALSNLRPLEKTENMKKHNRIDKSFQPSLKI